MPKSKYCNKVISEAQFLAELMCERQAGRKRINLHNNFWNTPEWKLAFQQEVIRANALLKLYPYQVVIDTLAANHWVPTLFTKKLPGLLDISLSKYNQANQIKDTIVPEMNTDYETQPAVKQSRLDKLRKLDG